MTPDDRASTFMRIAWFSPLPPVRSGIADYSAEIVPRLTADRLVDCFVDQVAAAASVPVFNAHDFVWKHQREPYDLVVYQLGNAAYHDYMWAYLARYPGLAVLHDARLHHARARRLLDAKRFDDYRAEFWHDHPDAPRDFVEYAVEGLGGPIYYFWRMLGVVMQTARMVVVHNERVAAELRGEYPGVPIDAIRMGVAASPSSAGARDRIRAELGVPPHALLFTVFGRVTAEKRIGAIARAIAALDGEGCPAHLLVIGHRGDGGDRRNRDDGPVDVAGQRVHVAGHVPHEAIGDFLSAADACLCLRWPTAQETSASWLRCLAAGRPTVISHLAHLVDIPTIDPRTWQPSHPSRPPVAIAIDLLDEDGALLQAMRRLAADARFRDELGAAGRAYWAADHTIEAMADDYRRLLHEAAARAAPIVRDLPPHFTNDYAGLARTIARHFGVDVDIIRSAG
jgi:glycosyltransferase involved in cell wall biosynthesis